VKLRRKSVLSYSSIALLLRPRGGFEGKRSQKARSAMHRRPAPSARIPGLRSKAEMRKLLDRKIVEQTRQCAICQVAFTNYNDIVPDHIDPRGMEGSSRDDHPENIQAVHFWCNGEKGSIREY
jgi:hypothetical protein